MSLSNLPLSPVLIDRWLQYPSPATASELAAAAAALPRPLPVPLGRWIFARGLAACSRCLSLNPGTGNVLHEECGRRIAALDRSESELARWFRSLGAACDPQSPTVIILTYDELAALEDGLEVASVDACDLLPAPGP